MKKGKFFLHVVVIILPKLVIQIPFISFLTRLFLCQNYRPQRQRAQEDQEEQDDRQGVRHEEGAAQGPREGAVLQHAHRVPRWTSG